MLIGIGGDMARDILVMEIPTVLRTELYAIAALIGAAVVVVRRMLPRSLGGLGKNIRAYSHLLGECGTIFVATTKQALRYRSKFPKCLDGAPIFLPTDNTALRRSLDYWFDSERVRPSVVGEFEDYALLRAFGETGAGVFPMPSVFYKTVQKQKGLRIIGWTDKVRQHFYAISAERKLQHPAVLAISNAARRELFK